MIYPNIVAVGKGALPSKVVKNIFSLHFKMAWLDIFCLKIGNQVVELTAMYSVRILMLSSKGGGWKKEECIIYPWNIVLG